MIPVSAPVSDALYLMESFATSTGCGIMNFTYDSDQIEAYGPSCRCRCIINSTSHKVQNAGLSASAYCLGATRYAGEQSRRFGRKYIYFCPAGFFFVVCPSDVFSFAAGPLLSADYDVEEAVSTLQIAAEKIPLVKDFIDSIPRIEPYAVSHIANILWLVASYASSESLKSVSLMSDCEYADQQSQIGDYIQNIKVSLVKNIKGYIAYPYDIEKQLIYAITLGNLEDSRKYLNEILGNVFFSSANNLEIIKVRAMELAVMISRAAIDMGAEKAKIFDINIKFLKDFFSYDTIEEVCYCLTNILRQFTRETFEFKNVKHVSLISKAVSYIKSHFTRKITMVEVAAYVYLSPSHFSKIFKDEMNCTFNEYLNNLRIEKAKVLLLAENVNMIYVAEDVGYYDHSYFNKMFKKITGVTPKKFKVQCGNIQQIKTKSEVDLDQPNVQILPQEPTMAILNDISEMVQEGKAKEVKELIKQALEVGITAKIIIEGGLLPGMAIIGAKFKTNKVFVPEVLVSARVMKSGMDILKPYFVASDMKSPGKVSIGTVKGDIHDIGKNLVKMMMESKGIEVIDLGVDVSPEQFVQSIKDGANIT
ncbi:hypothetical protein FACS1894105_09330 [Clostridia bacterium]|nr:hypothetical protein FACS1894105_09330 [Clostridia bacterium]